VGLGGKVDGLLGHWRRLLGFVGGVYSLEDVVHFLDENLDDKGQLRDHFSVELARERGHSEVEVDVVEGLEGFELVVVGGVVGGCVVRAGLVGLG